MARGRKAEEGDEPLPRQVRPYAFWESHVGTDLTLWGRNEQSLKAAIWYTVTKVSLSKVPREAQLSEG